MFKRFSIFPKDTSTVLNYFVIYISLPAMVLLQVPKITFSSDIFMLVLIPFIITILSAIFIIYVSKILNLDRKSIGALLLVGVLGNTSFVGIPIVNYYYGSAALPYVMIYDQLGSFLLLNTYGAVVVVIYSSDDKIHLSNIFKKIFSFPPFIALLIALLLNGINFSSDFIKILELLSNTLIPLALVSVGFSLDIRIPKKYLSAFSLALGTKLILSPIIAFTLVYLFSFKGLGADVSILESSMGPMITAGVVASMAGFSSKLSSAIVGYGIIISFITTAIIVKLI